MRSIHHVRQQSAQPGPKAASSSRATRLAVLATAAKHKSRTENLRHLLQLPTILKGPCCHDALSARLIERAGFSFTFMSGFCTAGARLGAPDTGLISYAEMVDQGRYIMEATKHIPVIGDGDTGYGNAMNVKRTVKGYAQAGFAGILIEDQVAPKSCGHVRGKRVVSREEAVLRIRAAADARDEGSDILIVARTDARQAASLEEALWRVAAFADAGADVVFIDALESREEMRRFCRAGGGAAALPKMANMLEGGGKTPVLSPEELQELGYKLVAYPLSLLGVSIRAMEGALEGLREGQLPSPQQMGSFEDIQSAVGFPEYYTEEQRYAVSSPWSGTMSAAPVGAPEPEAAPASGHEAAQAEQAREEGWGAGGGEGRPAAAAAAAAATPAGDGSGSGSGGAVEADAVIEETGTAVVLSPPAADDQRDKKDKDSWNRRSQYFKVRISDVSTGFVKLETRIPTGFLSGLTSLVPSVAGFNPEMLMNRALNNENWDPAEPLFATTQGTDRIQVFLE